MTVSLTSYNLSRVGSGTYWLSVLAALGGSSLAGLSSTGLFSLAGALQFFARWSFEQRLRQVQVFRSSVLVAFGVVCTSLDRLEWSDGCRDVSTLAYRVCAASCWGRWSRSRSWRGLRHASEFLRPCKQCMIFSSSGI